ncbi:MAG: hypothetical protein FIA95_03075 [Gemmatimonadetes bacterium]|nr:hypothetical protein [Gemmatimonadota bacterium]
MVAVESKAMDEHLGIMLMPARLGALGLVVAGAGAQVLQSLRFGERTLDAPTFLGVPVLLLGVALLAAWVPARRVTRIDPVSVLKAN